MRSKVSCVYKKKKEWKSFSWKKKLPGQVRENCSYFRGNVFSFVRGNEYYCKLRRRGRKIRWTAFSSAERTGPRGKRWITSTFLSPLAEDWPRKCCKRERAVHRTSPLRTYYILKCMTFLLRRTFRPSYIQRPWSVMYFPHAFIHPNAPGILIYSQRSLKLS